MTDYFAASSQAPDFFTAKAIAREGWRRYCALRANYNRQITATAPLVGSAADAPVGPSIPSGHRLIQAAYDAREHEWPNGIHGADHWMAVAANGADARGADLEVVLLFSVLHDSLRRSDGRDYDHGKRAARLAGRLNGDVFTLDPRRFELLEFALAHHDGGATCPDPTIGACWDSDRLELPRVGITVKPAFMSTELQRSNQPQAVEWDDVLDRYRRLLGVEVPSRPERVVYHGTHGLAANAILAEGLRAFDGHPPFVSESRNIATLMATETTLAEQYSLYKQGRDWRIPGALFVLRAYPHELVARVARLNERVMLDGCPAARLIRVWLFTHDDDLQAGRRYLEWRDRSRFVDRVGWATRQLSHGGHPEH